MKKHLLSFSLLDMKILPFLYSAAVFAEESATEVTDEPDYDLGEELKDRKGKDIEPYPIIVGASSQQVLSISGLDGDIYWSKTIGDAVNSVPVITLNYVAYVTGKNEVQNHW